jgi:predicted glycoside hydrolase/deacetylase ChbG (UPF0249 family)
MNMPLVSKRSDLSPSHPKTSDVFIGDIYFKEDRLTRIMGHLRILKEGLTEIHCHPNYVDEDLKHLSVWTDNRVSELETLTPG